MPITSAARRRLAVVVLVLLAVLTGAVTARAATGTPDRSTSPTVMAHERSASARALHDAMRKLWEEHVAWTRLAIVDFAAGSGGFDPTAARLLQNQVDIGNAIKPYFGAAAGDQLAALLHDHITIAVEILQDAKAGDTAAAENAEDRWYANANDIADLLARANPRFWPDATMRQMMKTHLDQTLVEATDELTGGFAAGVAEYDEIEAHILDMADTLSAGIIGAFPRMFTH